MMRLCHSATESTERERESTVYCQAWKLSGFLTIIRLGSSACWGGSLGVRATKTGDGGGRRISSQDGE